MISPVTDRKLAEGIRRIRLAKDAGELPRGPVSLRTLAAMSGLSPATVAAAERMALASAAREILRRHAADLPEQATAKLLQLLSAPKP
jgi:hypothetical protein